MLTRLKVSGFKNLVDVDVRFGPFTCVAGANGVGKSNLFDAVRFLGALADMNLNEAAQSVRDEKGKTTDVRTVFHRVGDRYDEEITFEAEMIVPEEGVDHLGQKAKASTTFLRYSIVLGYRRQEGFPQVDSLELREEELVHINLSEATKHLLFKPSTGWRESVLEGRRTAPFISTEGEIIKLHQDGHKGRPQSLRAATLPRTVLSSVNASENPTALLARLEMRSWQLLQLEPSAMREPDKFEILTRTPRIGPDGSHLASTLYRLHQVREHPNTASNGSGIPDIYAHLAGRLSELVDDVREVSVDVDEKRQLLTLQVAGRNGTFHPARALSDGTLRFLALGIIESDPQAQGVLCLEEPENGIHPDRIPAMLRLLQDIAADVTLPVGSDNPLRQVIVNTHSPSLVAQVPDDCLIVAELRNTVRDGLPFQRASFGCLPDTWRTKSPEPANIVPRGDLLAYLNPIRRFVDENDQSTPDEKKLRPRQRRVVDRLDMRDMLPFGEVGQ